MPIVSYRHCTCCLIVASELWAAHSEVRNPPMPGWHVLTDSSVTVLYSAVLNRLAMQSFSRNGAECDRPGSARIRRHRGGVSYDMI